ncbi:lipopolysaccharide biosynthesis protein [Streptococcus uberis]|uniref:lipopolysaccharide biosynthesis protein n=1 Tax=Streptococcus uberis TaxID=1349 RepID=UPI000DFE35A1|nr:oligosaccharide flippase family protein [Streptococcus uberis]SUO91394.1 Polysaccharide biosynthesis protein [Streptococcus uberis]
MNKLKNRFKDVLKGNYFKNILILTSGSIIGQVIAVVCSPLLTRIYSPADIGIYSYILAMISTFTAIINGRYDMGIVSEKNNDRAFALVKLSFIIGTIFSIVASILFSIYFIWFKKEYSKYSFVLIFFFLILMSNNLINILNSWNNRLKEYEVLSQVNVIRSSFQNIGGVLLGLLKVGFFGLIFPYTVGQYMGITKQSKTMKPYFGAIKEVDKKTVKQVMLDYKRFPIFSAPALLANSFSYSSITIFMEQLFSLSTVGFYSLSTTILGLPLSLVSGNISKVFFREATSEYQKTKQYASSLKKTLLLLVALSIPTGIIMYFVAPWACSFFLGKRWVVAGEYIKILVPYYMVRFVGTSISNGFIISQKQDQELMIQILLVLTSVAALVITKLLNAPVEVFLFLIMILKSIVYALLIGIIWFDASSEVRKNV